MNIFTKLIDLMCNLLHICLNLYLRINEKISDVCKSAISNGLKGITELDEHCENLYVESTCIF